jgi:general secretion pathway protein J
VQLIYSKNENGFTLVEVMVAVTIIALLLTSVYGVFTSAAGAKQRLEAEGEGYHQARVLFDRMGRELRGAYYQQGKAGVRLVGGKTLDDFPYLELTTTAGTPYGGRRGGISVVRYELRTDPEAAAGDDTRVLMRDEYSMFEPAGEERAGYRLATGLGEMSVRFYKDGQWQEEWNTARDGGLPQMVEITLSMALEGIDVPFRSSFEIPLAAGGLPSAGVPP